MNIIELINIVDKVKPNPFTNDVKVAWINEVGIMITEQILSKYDDKENFKSYKKYDYRYDMERELKFADEFSDVYINYMMAKIDFYTAEYGRYNNSVALFETSFNELAKMVRRNNKPISKYELHSF